MSDNSINEQRTRTLQARLREEEADAAIFSKGVDMGYFSGFFTRPQKRPLFLFIPADQEPAFFIPDPYETQVTADSWVENITIWADDEDPVTVLDALVQELGLTDANRILVDETMWSRYTLMLMSAIDAEFELASDLVMEQRLRKSESELESFRRACEITDEVSEEIRALDAVGFTENQLASEIEYRLRQKGASGGSTQVASGPNSAKPPHSSSDRVIQAGEPVILDFGCTVDGYISDQCRTVVFEGDPPEGFIDAFKVVREAQEAAIAAIEPGVQASEVDRIARGVINDAGYEGRFLHVTGHGLGLDIHEPPYLMSGNYLDDGNKIQLDAGMITTVEPGIYMDDWGIRVEDDVIVTEDGHERLNPTYHGWEPLPVE